MTDSTRAAAYARDSGGHEQELSIEQQTERITEYCSQNQFALTRLFRDAARSGGKVAGRDQFLEMVRYLTDHAEEKILIFWSYSRFARDWDDSMYYLAYLRQHGIKIISIADPIPDTLDGRIMESLIAWQHAKFRETLAKDVRRGMRYAVSVNKAVVGPANIGYKTIPVQVGVRRDGSPHFVNRLVIDPETAPFVKLAWKMRADGYSYKEIHQKTRLFPDQSNYYQFFHKKIYLGISTWGGGHYEDYAPALIDEDIWARVQAINEQNMTRNAINHPRRAFSSYLLSGLVRCGRCGRVMSGLTANSYKKNKRYMYFNCPGRLNFAKPCDLTRYRADLLDAQVLNRIEGILNNPDELGQLLDKGRAQTQEISSSRQHDESQLKSKISKNERRISKIVAAIGEYGHSEALISELKNLEAERDAHRLELGELVTRKPHIHMPVIVDLEKFGSETWQAIEQADHRQRQLLLRALIKEIRIDRIDHKIVGEIEIKALPQLEEATLILKF